MSDFATMEDQENIRQILVHHLGHPNARDDDRKPLSVLDIEDFALLENDLLRYCSRLRCQPDTKAHNDLQGYMVPQHKLIGGQ